jgi:hypothetical protein
MSGERNCIVSLASSVYFSKERGKTIPIAMVNLGLCTEQLSLASLVGKVTTDLIAVFFCCQHGDEVDARPHLFAGEFAGGREC